jgi:hypothetical protein
MDGHVIHGGLGRGLFEGRRREPYDGGLRMVESEERFGALRAYLAVDAYANIPGGLIVTRLNIFSLLSL